MKDDSPGEMEIFTPSEEPIDSPPAEMKIDGVGSRQDTHVCMSMWRAAMSGEKRTPCIEKKERHHMHVTTRDGAQEGQGERMNEGNVSKLTLDSSMLRTPHCNILRIIQCHRGSRVVVSSVMSSD